MSLIEGLQNEIVVSCFRDGHGIIPGPQRSDFPHSNTDKSFLGLALVFLVLFVLFALLVVSMPRIRNQVPLSLFRCRSCRAC